MSHFGSRFGFPEFCKGKRAKEAKTLLHPGLKFQVRLFASFPTKKESNKLEKSPAKAYVLDLWGKLDPLSPARASLEAYVWNLCVPIPFGLMEIILVWVFGDRVTRRRTHFRFIVHEIILIFFHISFSSWASGPCVWRVKDDFFRWGLRVWSNNRILTGYSQHNNFHQRQTPQVSMGNDKPFSLAVPLASGRNDTRMCHYPISRKFGWIRWVTITLCMDSASRRSGRRRQMGMRWTILLLEGLVIQRLTGTNDSQRCYVFILLNNSTVLMVTITLLASSTFKPTTQQSNDSVTDGALRYSCL